jgi:hypothetical protein
MTRQRVLKARPPGSPAPLLPRRVANRLQILNFGHLEVGGQTIRYGSQADTGGEIPHTAVTFRHQQYRAKVKGRRVDENGLVLPLRRGQHSRVYQASDLRRQRLLRLRLAGDLNRLADGLAGEGLNLDQLVGVEGMGEVEADHNDYPCGLDVQPPRL